MSAPRIIGNIILLLLGLTFVAAGWFIYKIEDPQFQTALTQRVARYLSRKTQAEISIGHVELRFFRSIELSNVLLKDRSHDTLIAAKKISAQFSIISLLQNQYDIENITLDEAHVYLHRPQNDTNWNYQFLADALSGNKKSTQPSKVEITLAKVIMHNTHFEMIDEPNIIRLDFKVPATLVSVNKIDFNQPLFNLTKLMLEHADITITKLVRTEIDTSTFPQPDTGVVHINSKTIQLFVSDFQLMDSRFTYDDMNEVADPRYFDGFHQQYNHLNLHFIKGSLVLDTIKAHIENISTQEKGGFVLNHLEADARITPKEAKAENLKIETPFSSDKDFFSFSYTNFHAFLNFNEEVTLDANLDQSSISMKDIGYFIPAASGNTEKLLADGRVKGTLANLKSKNLKLQTGSNTRFSGNVDLKGLPNINETYIDLKINELTTNAADIQRWIPHTPIPAEISRLGNTHFVGSFSGFINDFVAYGTFNTQLGQITSDLGMKFKDENSSATYSGNLSTNNFNLGALMQRDSMIGTISFALIVNGSGLSLSSINAKMSGTVQQFQFLGYNYQNADVIGTLDSKVFTGTVNMDDKNIRLAFNGAVDLNPQLPVYNFKAQIDSANLMALKITDGPMMTSMNMDMNMSGKTIDDFLGYAKATNIVFSDDKAKWKMDSLLMKIDLKKNGNGRKMVLTTPFAQARFDGSFALTKLPQAFLSVIDHYFPSLPGDYPLADTLQDFDFKIALNTISGAEQFFLPELSGMDSTKIHGHFNSALHSIVFTGTVPNLGYRSFEFGNVYVNADTKNDSFRVEVGSHSLRLSDSLSIVDPVFITVLNNDVATVVLKGSSPDHQNYMNVLSKITGDSSQVKLHLLPSDLVLNGRSWKVSEDNLITYSDERMVFQNFALKNENRELTITNVNLRVRATNLEFNFKNIPIHDFHEFISWNDVALDGSLNGTLQVLNVFHTPRFIANTSINDFSANGKKVELVTAAVSYIPEDDRMTLDMQLSDPEYDVVASGTYFPRKETDALNVEVNVKKVDLQMLEAVLFNGMISNTKGSAYGKLSLEGTLEKPVLTGEMEVASLATKINYLQTTYSCRNQPVIFREGSIELGNLTLFDENGDSARARGSIFHDHLNDWSMNVAINTNKFLAMKTTERDDSIFYGTAVASGIIQFIGPVDQMEIRASVTSLKGTTISIPVSETSAGGQSSFIQYINKKEGATSYTSNGYERVSGLTLNFNMDITPAAEVQIIFDKQTGDIIRGTGNGNIRMEINTKGDFNMFGTFTIEQGNYLFTQFNFFNKYFTIEKGGTIVWNGDPYGATIALSAIYSTKASLIELVPQSAEMSVNDRRELQQRYRVDLYLKLTGSLFSPEIAFDIRLPEVSSVSSAASVELIRLKQDENEMNKQAFGIIVLGHFLPTDNSGLGGQNIGVEGINSLSGFISSQISSLASQIRSDVDFSLNYQSYEANLNSTSATDPNSLVKRNELQVALTKRFFNDRLAVDVGGNFDFGATNVETNQSTTGVAGDFAVEYKITPDGRVSGKVFSTSDYDVVDERNKTKNGIAIKYTREFDTLKELFKDPEKKKRKELKRQAKEQREQTPVNPPEPSAK